MSKRTEPVNARAEEKDLALLCWMQDVTSLLCYQPEVPQAHKESLVKALDDYTKRCAELPPPRQERKDTFAYSAIEEYEELVGFKVNEAFRTGWMMARTMNSHIAALAGSANGDISDRE